MVVAFCSSSICWCTQSLRNTGPGGMALLHAGKYAFTTLRLSSRGSLASRALASAARDPLRVTDASRQASVVKEPPRRPSSKPADPVTVIQVTPEQKAAAESLKKANEAAAAASKAASDAAALAAALKKVADEYAQLKKKAESEAVAAKQVADAAALAKRKADEEALVVLKKAADEEKVFLKKAFQSIDSDGDGILTQSEMQNILSTLKLPSNPTDVDDLIQIMDLNGWVTLMPQEMKDGLKSHPSAKEWSN
mmetsp:Transcript_156546/g.276482  ORF Transcript_156546/g.276482 Transcript_156546/m.276482 type:complete len:252 (-) Transcript_156546:45-800(-)